MARMSLQTAFDQARQWLETNDLDRAIGMAHHILETYPHCLEAHQMLGEARLSSRQYEDARADFERVLQFDPEHIPALVGLGMSCERLGQLDRAIAAFERALEIKPDLPELRNQLLRLYTDAWGSEYAHLRLSRAGLARLYAKGHMLPQAISEFRQVVADQPDRLDARVALAEALWRDEQEEEAAETCRAILAKHPHVLKANLILGYIELASGNPSGEHYWRTAAAIDPYQVMARTLFESLPPVDVPEPMLPEWDEIAWLNRQASAPAEQLAATRSMEATTPTAVSAPPPPPPPALTPTYADSDDFLASLLAIDAAPPLVSHPVEETDVDVRDTRPFTLEELGLSDVELASAGAPEEEMSATADVAAQAEAATVAPAAEETPDLSAMQPFSLEELGLTPEEIAALDSVSASAPAAEEAPDLSAMQPFSLEELGLTPEEIASLSGETITSASEAAQPEDVDIDMQPFSLDDIELEGIGRTPAVSLGASGLGAVDVPPDLQPFSIEELETGSMSGQADLGELPPSLQPFSLDEPPASQRPRMAGLTPEEVIESPLEEEETFLPRGFSWQQPAQRTEPSFFKSASAPSTPETGTIFSKLQKQRESVQLPGAEEPPMPPIAPDEHLGLFSLDNVSLRDDEPVEAGAPVAAVAPAEEERPQPVISSGLPEQPAQREDVAAPSSSGEQPHIASLEEVESIESAIASGVIQPFSFADLGLTEEEIAALGLSAAPETPVAQEETGVLAEEPPAAVAPPVEAPAAPPAPERTSKAIEEVESIEEALASGQLQPFSFADLGLSEEEIAALGLGDAGGSAQPSASVAPETPEASAPEIDIFEAPSASETSAEPPPIVEEEALETGVEEPLIEDLRPFSLADLGLSEEELAEFDLSGLENAEGTYDEGRLGITEEELAALGTGGDLEWVPESSSASEPSVAAFEPGGPSPASLSDDEIVDRLIRIGRERGYVDIADIIATVKDPEAEAARIEEIGRRLHAARIEIRDGDEIIDLDAEYAEEEASPAPESAAAAAFDEEEEDLMRPFSLEELGLSDDEIAMLAAAASRTEEPPAAPAEEPPLTPFSLEELGLSDDEIAMLAAAASRAEEPPAAPAEEPPLTPFSLEELGLSGDEIALLNETAAAVGTPPPSPAVSEADATAWFDLEPVVAETEAAAPLAPQTLDLKEAQPPITTPAPAPPAPPAPPAAPPVQPAHDLSDYPELREYLQMLEADPDNHLLRLSIARVGGQVGMTEIAMQHYRRLIKQNALLDEIVEDLTDMIAETSDTNLLRKLHRALGDAYSRQGRFRDAMREYSWIPGQG